MEIRELHSYFVNKNTETLQVNFSLITDSDDEIRIAEISLNEIKTYGFDFDLIQNSNDDFEDDEEDEDDLFDSLFEDIIDDSEIISFLNEYYMINPKLLPKVELY